MAEYYLGEIKLFAGGFAPVDFALCNGAMLQVSQNQALFALLSTTYGGNGSSTFGIPDLQGRVPVHQGQGVGLTNRVLGQQGGTETVVLNTSNVPVHSHTFNATTVNTGLVDSPANAILASPPSGYQYLPSSVSYTLTPMATAMVGNGGGYSVPGAHENMMPSIGLTFIIATNGLYPQQS